MINRNNRKILYLTVITFALCLSIGISLARFAARVQGNEGATDIIVTTDNLLLNYKEGNNIQATGVFPNLTYTKVFEVENESKTPTTFSIGLIDVNNTFLYGELVASAVCVSYDANTNEESGTCASFANTVIPSSDGRLFGPITIPAGYKYKYVLSVTFLETNSSQNYNQGAIFNAKIDVSE